MTVISVSELGNNAEKTVEKGKIKRDESVGGIRLPRFFVEKELADVYNYEEKSNFSYSVSIGDAMLIL